MEIMQISYAIGTTVMSYFLAFIWKSNDFTNLCMKMFFTLNAITGTIIIINYFTMRV